MSLRKMVKNLTTNHMVLFTVVAAALLIYHTNAYSGQKGSVLSGMRAGSHGGRVQGQLGVREYGRGTIMNPETSPNEPETNRAGGTYANCCAKGNQYGPSQPLGQNEINSHVSGIATNLHGLPPSCTRQPIVNPAQLLPKQGGSRFSKMNPMGAGSIQDVSLLKAGYHIGINTVGQSLRNANRQLRSEPPNPQQRVGPWNTSTIGPDFNRRPLEIGCGPF